MLPQEEPRAGPSLTRKPKVSTSAVAYPDKQQSDETGIKKQEEKRRKAYACASMPHAQKSKHKARFSESRRWRIAKVPKRRQLAVVPRTLKPRTQASESLPGSARRGKQPA